MIPPTKTLKFVALCDRHIDRHILCDYFIYTCNITIKNIDHFIEDDYSINNNINVIDLYYWVIEVKIDKHSTSYYDELFINYKVLRTQNANCYIQVDAIIYNELLTESLTNEYASQRLISTHSYL